MTNYSASHEHPFPSADKTFEHVRTQFPAASTKTYLDTASRSLIPENALDIASQHLRERLEGRIDKQRYFDIVELARSRFAQLIGAQPHDIAITKNVSEGLNIIAAAIDWQMGDEIILCSAIEHPNNVYTWRNQERRGVLVRDLPTDNGLFPLQTALEILQSTKPPKLLTVSATSFKPGFRTDLDTLGAACRQAGTLLVVDGAQSAGLTHLDVSKTHIDAFATSTQKGLCALYGMGFLYVRTELAESLSPRYLARFGVDIEAIHEADYDPGPIKLRQSALRFDLGNYNFLGAALVSDTLGLLNKYGTKAIDKHNKELATTLAEGFKKIGAPVVAPTGADLANIVSLRFPDNKGRSGYDLQAHLKSQDVHVAVRGDVVRFSVHLYNNQSDIRHALDKTAQWLDEQD